MTRARRIQLPLYLVVLLLVALGLNLVRGFELARRRAADLRPARCDAVLRLGPDPGAQPLQLTGHERFLLVQLEAREDARLALHQIFPERDVLRWLEDEASDTEWLVVPLAGLPEGEFAFRWAGDSERARAVDPDWVQPERVWLGSFSIPAR